MIGRFGETDAMANVCINVVCRTNVSKIKIIIMTLRFTVLLLPAYCFLSVFRFLFPESSPSHSVPETGYLSVPHRYFQLCNDQHFVQMSEINNRCNAS